MRDTTALVNIQATARVIDEIQENRDEIIKIEKKRDKAVAQIERAAQNRISALMRKVGKDYGIVRRFCKSKRESLTSGWKRKFAYILEHVVRWRDRDTLWFEGKDGEDRALQFLKQEVAKDPNSKFAKLLRWTPEISRSAFRENLELAREVPGFVDLLERESFAIVLKRREQLSKNPFTRELEFASTKKKK